MFLQIVLFVICPCSALFCTSLVQPDLSSLRAAQGPILACGSGASCNDSSGACRVIGLTNRFSVSSTSSPISQISFPLLTSVTGDFQISQSAALVSVSLPSLRAISGTLSFSNNAMLQNISLPLLQNVQSVAVSKCANLRVLNFQALRSLFAARIVDNNLLETVVFPMVVEAPYFEVLRNAMLFNVSFPAMTTTSGALFYDNPILEILNFPSWTNDTISPDSLFELRNNFAIKSLSFPALSSFGSFSLINNVALRNVSLPSLLESNFNFAGNIALSTVFLPKLTKCGLLDVTADSLDVLNTTSLQSAQSVYVSRCSVCDFSSLVFVNQTSVKACAAGLGVIETYLSKKAVICQPCLHGFFNPNPSQSPCLSCRPGDGSGLQASEDCYLACLF